MLKAEWIRGTVESPGPRVPPDILPKALRRHKHRRPDELRLRECCGCATGRRPPDRTLRVARDVVSKMESALSGFKDVFRGELIDPSHAEYDAARVVWNGMVDRRPALIARCADSGDVVSAIRFAREHDLVVAVRSGGHSVAGFSTCDGGLLIDLARMRGARVDTENRTATVSGGALLRELDLAAQEWDLACPVGVVSHTGVAGLTLGGGMGRLQRKHGLTIDNLLAVDLVTADGNLIRVAEETNPELFWAVRGAGANFGVATSFEFRLHPVGPMITHGLLVYTIDRAHEVAARFAEFGATGPDEMMPTLTFGTVGPDDPWSELEGKAAAVVQVTHSGGVDDAARDLAPLHLERPVADTVKPKQYLSVQGANDEELAWGKRFYMKGGFVNAIPDELIDACIEGIGDAPGRCGIGFWAQGGAMAQVPVDSTAFTGRDAAFWIGLEAFWEDPAQDDEFAGWGRRVWETLKRFTADGHYVNDVIETGQSVVRSIYGDAKYERLLALKRTYDPENVFRLNQNVVP
jgi:FAD/FMN-containing dehydrogenase